MTPGAPAPARRPGARREGEVWLLWRVCVCGGFARCMACVPWLVYMSVLFNRGDGVGVVMFVDGTLLYVFWRECVCVGGVVWCC